MKEIKFNSRSELYTWAGLGKVIKHGLRGRFTTHKPNSDGEYSLDFHDDLISYSGIEETPVRKLYAYVSGESVCYHLSDNDKSRGLYNRAPYFDLTFPEKEGE